MLKQCTFIANPLRLKFRNFSSTSLSFRWQPSYFSSPGTEPLLSTTVGEVVESVAQKHPDREAIVVCHQKLRKTYSQFSNDVDKLAAGFVALGLNKDDRIGIWSPSSYEWVLVQFASAKAGLVLVTINPSYQANEVEHCLDKLGIRAMVMAETFRTSNYYSILKTVIPTLADTKAGETKYNRLPNLTHVIIISDKHYEGVHQFQEVIEAGGTSEQQRLAELKQIIQFDDPVNVQFTSGTTGVPKAATLSHHNIVNNAHSHARLLGLYDKNHRIGVLPPLFHCFGCVIGTLATFISANCAIFSDLSFKAQTVMESIQNEKITVIYGTPTMYIDMLNLPDFDEYDVSSLETGVMSATHCPEEIVIATIKKLNKGLVTAYGSTEMSPLVSICSPTSTLEERLASSGRILPHLEAKVVDNEGKVVGIGSSGELMCRGYGLMLGYWNDEKKTREAITADRWYRTGDIVIMDTKGNVTITGRKKDMIIRGGENIYPSEIENVLHTHPNIIEVQVVGVPDHRLGEEICAWIRVKQGITLSSDEVKDFCKSKISYFKIPRYIMFVDEFPKTASGKVRKDIMRQESKMKLNLK